MDIQPRRASWRQLGNIAFLLSILMLAACGSAGQGEAGQNSDPPATAARTPTPDASDRPAVTPSTTADLTSSYAGIPQSRTAEGYYLLGDPDAPVVLTYYSDFL